MTQSHVALVVMASYADSESVRSEYDSFSEMEDGEIQSDVNDSSPRVDNRSSFERALSQAQNDTQESQWATSPQFQGIGMYNKSTSNRAKRSYTTTESDTNEFDTETVRGLPTMTRPASRTSRRSIKKMTVSRDLTGANTGPMVVIFKSADMNLAKISPLKIAKALNDAGKNYVKSVTQTREGGIAVTCFNAAQAEKLKGLDRLGDWAVTADYPKSEIQCKGVISGVPLDVSEKEVMEICDSVVEAKRLKTKRSGKLEDSMAMCLTFDKKILPGEVRLGFQVFSVRPYVPTVIRCFKCQRIGHTAEKCKGTVRCVRCGGPHKYDDCPDKDKLKCVRCGGAHSAAYEGCETIKEERKIQQVRAYNGMSYAAAARSVREESYIAPGTQKTYTNMTNMTTTQNDTSKRENFVTPPSNRIHNNKVTTNRMVTMCDAQTQTVASQQTQTEQHDDTIKIGPKLVKLLINAIQVCDKTKSLQEKEVALEALVARFFKSEGSTGGSDGVSSGSLSCSAAGGKVKSGPYGGETVGSRVARTVSSGSKSGVGIRTGKKPGSSSQTETENTDTNSTKEKTTSTKSHRDKKHEKRASKHSKQREELFKVPESKVSLKDCEYSSEKVDKYGVHR